MYNVVKIDEEDIDNLTAELINLRWDNTHNVYYISDYTIRKRVQEYTATHTRKKYQGEWAVNTYEPYQMQALSIVSLISIHCLCQHPKLSSTVKIYDPNTLRLLYRQENNVLLLSTCFMAMLRNILEVYEFNCLFSSYVPWVYVLLESLTLWSITIYVHHKTTMNTLLKV